jgi:hypothetical protein
MHKPGTGTLVIAPLALPPDGEIDGHESRGATIGGGPPLPSVTVKFATVSKVPETALIGAGPGGSSGDTVRSAPAGSGIAHFQRPTLAAQPQKAGAAISNQQPQPSAA